jgi:hypothetical protein
LSDSIDRAKKIEATYRTSAADRGDAAKLIGFRTLSGPANKTLAALASYGLVERAGTGMLRVTPLAQSIIHPRSEVEKREALLEAAQTPQLFREIREQFPDLPVPPEAGVITHLNRAGFNPNAVPKAAKAFLETARYVEQIGEWSSKAITPNEVMESEPLESPTEQKLTCDVEVGDFVQWESQGALQFEEPRRVRWISDDGAWLAVEGSGTGIPVREVSIDKNKGPKPPPIPSENAGSHGLTDVVGQRKAVFPVSDGDVTFIFPEDLTLEGIEELEAYLAVFLKKEKRKMQGS